MNFRKILSLLCVLAMMMTLCQSAVFGAGTVAITSPANGEIVTDDFSKITFSVPEASFYSLLLDEKEIISAVADSEELSYELSEKLLMGVHTLSLRVADEESGFTEVVTNFTVAATEENEVMNMSFKDGSLEGIAAPSATLAGKDANGEDVYAIPSTFDGSGGEKNGAIGFSVAEMEEITISEETGIYYFISMPAGSTDAKYTLEYDLFLENPGAFELETKDSNGNWGWIGGKNLFGSDGFVAGTSYKYPVGEWMKVSHTVDTLNGIQSLNINGNNLINMSSGTLKNLVQMKLQYYIHDSKGVQGFRIDNLKLIEENLYNGFTDLYYLKKDGSLALVSNNTISASTNTIALATEMVLPTTYDKKNVTVLADGVVQNISKVEIVDNRLGIEFEEILPLQAQIEVHVKFKKNKGGEFVAFKSFKTNAITFGAKEVKFYLNDVKCFSENQIKSGDVLKAELDIRNSTINPESAVCALLLYSEGRIVAASYKSVQVSEYTSSQKLPLTVTIPEGYDNFTVKSFMIDSYKFSKPVAGIYNIK